VVGHLEGAKERRQVLIATHSANLVVLGDAELVIPMRVEGGKGAPFARGAVDQPETRNQVCSLLEGGAQAYKKRVSVTAFDSRPTPISRADRDLLASVLLDRHTSTQRRPRLRNDFGIKPAKSGP
jgi:hypothetical protein